jgi:hypothetical protein
MVRDFAEVVGMADRQKVNNPITAYMLAMERLATVHKLRGMYA